MRRWLVTMIAAALVAGCANKPPAPLTCGFTRYRLAVEDPRSDPRVAATESGAPTLASVLRTATTRPPTEAASVEAPAGLLFMSGGGQNGAFGAGYLDGWKKRAGRLPPFRAVTGISTGAILAPFAFVDRPEVAVRGYTITDERELLTPFGSGPITVLRKGAFADLRPLRVRLAGLIDDAMLTVIAAGARAGRKLLVGVVDVDTGEAIALDLTLMASRWAAPTADRLALKDCFIEAIVASSSAPLAAPPVFIDNRMYIDGGARFGVFSDEVGHVIDPPVTATEAAAVRPTAHVLVNGTLRTSFKCGKVDKRFCQPPDSLDGAHKNWDIIGLALRSEDILQNQVYRFAARYVAAQSAAKAGGERLPFRFAKIDDDAPSHLFTMPAGDIDTGEKTCAEWRARDEALLEPIQFYPRYMRCMIDYGRTRAAVDAGR